MRVLTVLAALILVFLGVATPRMASAQDVNGRLALTVHMCVNPPVFPYASYPTVFGTFDETLCYIESSADPSQNMTIQLDGGADGFTVTERFAPLFWPDISLTPGAYTLTITTPQRDGPLVTSTAVTIAADQTTSLTYTLIYPLEVGSVPPPPPMDEVPEVPVDPVATPAPTEEVVTSDPVPPVADDAGDVSTVPDEVVAAPDDVAPELADPVAVAMLPNTGSGSIGSSSVFTRASVLLAAFGVVAGATAIRLRRT
jgi:hypothetical protein